MRFQATEKQIKWIAVKAIDASKPLDSEAMSYLPAPILDPEDINLTEWGLRLDDVAGRSVKLFINRQENNWWHVEDSVDPEHQAWVRRYASIETLIGSVLERV